MICVLVVVLVAGRVEAQPGLTRPQPVAVAPVAKRPLVAKRGSTAATLGIAVPLLATGVGFALTRGNGSEGIGAGLFFGGLIVGPAPGLWYAGHGGGLGMTARGVTMMLAIGTVVGIADADYDDCISSQSGCDPDAEYAEYQRDVRIMKGLLVIGAAAYVTSWVYDARESARVVDRWNRKHGLTVAPTVMTTATGRSPGMMLSAQF